MPPPEEDVAEDLLGAPADPVPVRHRVHRAGAQEQERRERVAAGSARERGEHHLPGAVAAGDPEHVDPLRPQVLDGALELLGRGRVHHLPVPAQQRAEPPRQAGVTAVPPRQRVVHDADAAHLPPSLRL